MKRLFILFFIYSCSSSSRTNQSQIVGNDFELPGSVKTLKNIKDRNSIEFTIASHQAITDVINHGKSSLASSNSSLALQYLSVGSNLFPYREDIVSLKKVALDRYINTTNELIKHKDVPCSTLKMRAHFLVNIAPDAMGLITEKREHCDLYAEADPVTNTETIANLKLPPTQTKIEEQYNIDLSKDYEYMVWKNNFFPKDEVALLLLRFFGTFQIVPREPNVEQGRDEFVNLSTRYKFKTERESMDADDFCEELGKLIDVQSGQEIICTTGLGHSYDVFHVGKRTASNLAHVIRSPRFIADLVLQYHDGREVTKHLLMEDDSYSPFSTLQAENFFESGKLDGPQYYIKGWEYSQRIAAPKQYPTPDDGIFLTMHPAEPTRGLTISYLKTEMIKGLKQFELRLNPQKTFELYTQHIFK